MLIGITIPLFLCTNCVSIQHTYNGINGTTNKVYNSAAQGFRAIGMESAAQRAGKEYWEIQRGFRGLDRGFVTMNRVDSWYKIWIQGE